MTAVRKILGYASNGFYTCTVGLFGLAVCIWGGYYWGLDWSHGYDIYFWAWACGLFGIWLSFRLPAAQRFDLLLIALWLGAVALRLWNLFTVPFETGDLMQRQTVVDVVNVPQAGVESNVFFTRWGFYLAPSFVAAAITGDSFTGFRAAAAAWDALALAGAAILARLLAGRALGALTLVVIGLSWWDNANARVHPIMAAACGAVWSWWAVWRACEKGDKADAILAGVIIGLALRLYEPVKILVVVLPLWWTYHALVTRGFAARTWRSMALIAAVALMTLWPMLTHGGREFFFEAPANSIWLASQRHSGELTGLLAHMAGFLRIFTGDKADLLVNRYIDLPMLNPVEIGLIVIGLALAVSTWREPRATIAPMWLVVTCVAVAVSSQPEAARRLSVALPAIGVLAAGALLAIARVRRYGPILVAAIIAVDAWLNWRAYCVWSGVCD